MSGKIFLSVIRCINKVANMVKSWPRKINPDKEPLTYLSSLKGHFLVLVYAKILQEVSSKVILIKSPFLCFYFSQFLILLLYRCNTFSWFNRALLSELFNKPSSFVVSCSFFCTSVVQTYSTRSFKELYS